MIKIKLSISDKDFKNITLSYKDMTIDEIIAELKIDKDQIGAVLVNGIPKNFSDKVEDKSEVFFLPILSGG
jgi:sulfur carrier protein ThiS